MWLTLVFLLTGCSGRLICWGLGQGIDALRSLDIIKQKKICWGSLSLVVETKDFNGKLGLMEFIKSKPMTGAEIADAVIIF